MSQETTAAQTQDTSAPETSATTPVLDVVGEQPPLETINPETAVAASAAETAPVAKAAAVVTVAPVVVHKQVAKSAAKVDSFDEVIAAVEASGTSDQRNLVAFLQGYVTKMAPGVPFDFQDGAKVQYNLWKTIHSVTENYTQDDFRKLWFILLAFFHKHSGKGAFGERYVFRASEFWTHGDDELNAFQRILNLLIITADPVTRQKGLASVSVTNSVHVGFSEEARQRVLTFYGA